MGALLWIVRALGLLLILRFVLRALSGSRRPAGGGVPPRNGRGVERVGGELVRDPHCGTYVPQTRAIVVGTGADAQYFCSTDCRDAHAKR